MKTKTLLCDIDGCLANWNDAFRALLESLHGPRTVQTLEQAMAGWDWPKRLGYTNKEIDQAWEKVDWDWWFTLPQYAGASDAIGRLSGYGGLEDLNEELHVYYVTGRHASARHASADWLASMGACCPSVITTSRKAHLAKVFARDGEVAVIEDKPILIEDYYVAGVEPIYVIDQPYNRDLSNAIELIRVDGVDTALDDLIHKWSLKTQTPPAESTEAQNDEL